MKKLISTYIAIITTLLCSCNIFTQTVELESVTFEDSKKEISVGENTFCNIIISPSDAENVNLEFETIPEGYIEIKSSSKNGVVIEGIKSGSCVLTAKSGNLIDYLQIEISGKKFTTDPYIVLPYVTVEMEKGSKKTIIANLIGGSAADNNAFTWETSDKKVCSVDGSGNSGILTAGKCGIATITVKNEKSLYSASMIVYVPEFNKQLFYLTTSSNVFTVKPGEISSFEIKIIGGTESDYKDIKYEVETGSENFSVVGNNGVCSVNGLKKGKGKIRITHTKADVDLSVEVIVDDVQDKAYIEASKDLIVIDGVDEDEFECNLVGTEELGIYSFEVQDEEIVEVFNFGNKFYVNSKNDGYTTIFIKNSLTDFIKEITVIVENTKLVTTECYISTTQNVIKTEVGADEITLYMNLIGGNESDRNGFKWEINDSGIIEFLTNDGTVTYARNILNINADVYEAKGIIKPVGVGQGIITVTHPKTEVIQKVFVYVYPEGTFSVLPLKIRGKSVVEIVEGQSYEYKVEIIQGERQGEFEWTIDDEKIAEVSANGNEALISAKGNGKTVLHIKGAGLEESYDVPVVCGTRAEIEKTVSIYTEDKDITVTQGYKVYSKINGTGLYDESKNQVLSNDESICKVMNIGSVICFQGISKGQTEIIVCNEDAENKVVIPVKVVEEQKTLDKPYSLTGEHFVGVVKGKEINYEISSDGLTDSDLALIKTEIKDGSEKIDVKNENGILKIKGIENGVSILEINHPKANNSFILYIYVVETEEELKKRNVIAFEKKNYLIEEGEFVYLKAALNFAENKDKIVWKCDEINCIEINTDNENCIVKGINEGNAVITVSCENSLPVNIYISVVKKNNEVKDYSVKLPSIVEMIKNERKTINAETEGLTEVEKGKLKWTGSEGLDITYNGSSCSIGSAKKGVYELTLLNENDGYEKTINIIVYDSEAELYSSYVIGIEKTVYKIKKDSILDIELKSGSKQITDETASNLKWKAEDNGIVNIYEDGMKARFVALNEGVCEVTVKGKNVINELKFRIIVSEEENNSDINFTGNRIIKVKKNETNNYEYHLYENGNEIKDYENVNIYVKNENICSFARTQNMIRFEGKEEGESYITVEYNDMTVTLLLCIYIEENNDIFFFEKDHYLLKKNTEAFVKIINDNDTKEYVWTYDEGISVTKISNKEYKIKAVKEGNYQITVRDGNYSKICYVSVNNEINESTEEIYVPQIIVLEPEETYLLQTVCTESVYYSVQDFTVCSYTPEGNSCTLTAHNTGITELKIFVNNTNYKCIKIIVTEDKNNISNFNINKRFYSLTENEGIKIKPYLYGGFNAENIEYTDVYGNGCIEINTDNNVLNILATKEGVAGVNVKNKIDEKSFTLYFMIKSKEVSGGEVRTDSVYYLYTEKNALYINNGETGSLTVNVGDYDNYFQDDLFNWECSDYSVCTLQPYPDGYGCYVVSKNEGEANITVTNRQCSNSLTYKVYVGEKYVTAGTKTKYIKAENNLVSLEYKGESKNIVLELCNIEGSTDNITYECDDYSISNLSIVKSQNKIILSFVPLMCGKAVYTFHHPSCDFDTNITVIVNDVVKGNKAYITTGNNYTLVKPGKTEKIEVSLVNYEEYDSSNYEWSIVGGASYVTLIGKGNSIQVYGNKEGLSTIRVRHTVTDSFLDLYVMVSSSVTELKYITTAENIIETTVSENLDSFTVNLVGGVNEDSNFTYSVSDSSILSIIGNQNTCYYRGLKEGTVQITVANTSDSNIPELKITVIVGKENTEGAYILPSSSIVYLKPNGNSKTIDVTVNNMGSYDINSLDWFIYTQKAAYSNGDVCSIVSSGDQCVIKPLNAGSAKIRCVYAPTGIFTNIYIYVSDSKEISFKEDSVTVEENDCVFVNISIPDCYEGIEDYISFSSDKADVCSVFGTSKVACIYGKKEGTCIIRVNNNFDGTYDEMAVTVEKEEDLEYSINLSKNTLLLNPRSKDVVLNAIISGKKITGNESDELEWTISGNQSLSLYPSKGSSVVLQLNKCTDSSDPDFGTVKTGSAIITVRHNLCGESYKKTIYVTVEEEDNYFTLDKYSINIDAGSTEKVKANIVNASINDYENIVWSIAGMNTDANGNKVEVAKVLNESGQTCNVYGLADGICTLSAFYGGDIVQCEVNVTSGKVFKLSSAANVNMLPDEGEDFSVKVNYILKPTTMIPQWTVTDNDKDHEILTIKEVKGEQAIRLYGHGYEGTATITGFVAGVGMVNIYVTLKYDNLLDYWGNGKVAENLILKDGEVNEHKFYFKYSPYSYYPKVTLSVSDKKYETGYFTYTLEKEGENLYDNVRKAWIKVQCLKEIPVEAKVKFTVDLYRDSAYKDKVSGLDTLKFEITSALYNDSGYNLYFKRINGNMTTYGNQNEYNGYDCDEQGNYIGAGKAGAVMKKIGSTEKNFDSIPLFFGDAEEHMIIAIPKHKGQYGSDINLDINNYEVNKDLDSKLYANIRASGNFDLRYQSGNNGERGETAYVVRTAPLGESLENYDFGYKYSDETINKDRDGTKNIGDDGKFYSRFYSKDFYCDGIPFAGNYTVGDEVCGDSLITYLQPNNSNNKYILRIVNSRGTKKFYQKMNDIDYQYSKKFKQNLNIKFYKFVSGSYEHYGSGGTVTKSEPHVDIYKDFSQDSTVSLDYHINYKIKIKDIYFSYGNDGIEIHYDYDITAEKIQDNSINEIKDELNKKIKEFAKANEISMSADHGTWWNRDYNTLGIDKNSTLGISNPSMRSTDYGNRILSFSNVNQTINLKVDGDTSIINIKETVSGKNKKLIEYSDTAMGVIYKPEYEHKPALWGAYLKAHPNYDATLFEQNYDDYKSVEHNPTDSDFRGQYDWDYYITDYCYKITVGSSYLSKTIESGSSVSSVILNTYNVNRDNLFVFNERILGNLEYLYPNTKKTGLIGGGSLPYYTGNASDLIYSDGLILPDEKNIMTKIGSTSFYNYRGNEKYFRHSCNTGNYSYSYDFFGNKQWVVTDKYGYVLPTDNFNAVNYRYNNGSIIFSYKDVKGNIKKIEVPYGTYLYNGQNNVRVLNTVDKLTNTVNSDNSFGLYKFYYVN